MTSSLPLDRASPFDMPELVRWVNYLDNPALALKARQLARGGPTPVNVRQLINALRVFADTYEPAVKKANAMAAISGSPFNSILKARLKGTDTLAKLQWKAKSFGINERNRFSTFLGIDRLRTYVRAHFGGELCVRTAELLVNSLCHQCSILEAELLTLDEAVDLLEREPAPVAAPVVESPEPAPSEGLLLCPGATKDQLEEVAAIRRSNQRAGDKLLNIDRIKTIAEGLTCRQIGDYLGVKHQTVCKTRWWKAQQRKVNERNHQAKHAWRRD